MGDRDERIAFIATPSDEDLAAYFPKGHPYDFGFVPAMSKLVAAHMGIAPFFGQLFRHLMFGPGKLERAEREMVAAVAAAAQDCHY